MKRETCGKPVKGLPKQEKSREAEGRRKGPTICQILKNPTITNVNKAHDRGYIREPHDNRNY